MELGGTLCSIHGEPACGRCPISMHCLAFQRQEAQAEHSGQPGRLVKVTDFPIKAWISRCSVYSTVAALL